MKKEIGNDGQAGQGDCVLDSKIQAQVLTLVPKAGMTRNLLAQSQKALLWL